MSRHRHEDTILGDTGYDSSGRSARHGRPDVFDNRRNWPRSATTAAGALEPFNRAGSAGLLNGSYHSALKREACPQCANALGAAPLNAAWRGCQDGMPIARGEVMHILWMLIIGLVIGALAKLVMPGKDPGGAIITIMIGVVGSLIAGFLGRSLGWYHDGESAGFIASILGAVILLAGYRMIVGRRNVA